MAKCQPRCVRWMCDHAHFMCFMLAVAGLANLLSTPVPEGFQNPTGLKAAFSFWKSYVLVIEYVGWTFGVDNGYLFFKYTVAMAPPGILSYGVQAKDAKFAKVPVRIYEPPTAHKKDNRALVFYHGGGWLVGSIDKFDTMCRRIASGSNSIVVSVEYRLGPEFYFPIPLEDCVDATKHFMNHAAAFKVDPRRVAVMGDSAGGNLAAAVAIQLRDTDQYPPLQAQILLYPALQPLDFHTPSYQKNNQDAILSRENMAGFWLLYAQGHTTNRPILVANNHTSPEVKTKLRATHLNYDNIPRDMINRSHFKPMPVDVGDQVLWDSLKETFMNPYFSPLMAESLAGLPPAFVMSMENDVLRDDSFFYAHRLQQEGNNVTYINYKNGYHGIMSVPLPFIDTDVTFDITNKYISEHL